MSRAPATPDKKTFRIAEQLRRLSLSDDIDVFGPEIIAIMEAAGESFRVIDERPCYFDDLDGRFGMLRAVRNHPVWGRRLFAAVALKRRRRSAGRGQDHGDGPVETQGPVESADSSGIPSG